MFAVGSEVQSVRLVGGTKIHPASKLSKLPRCLHARVKRHWIDPGNNKLCSICLYHIGRQRGADSEQVRSSFPGKCILKID